MNPTIKIHDNGVTPINQVPVIVTQTQEVPVFSGTSEELSFEINQVTTQLNNAKGVVTSLTAKLAQLQSVQSEVAAQIQRLPARTATASVSQSQNI